jgi:hypothetical protein
MSCIQQINIRIKSNCSEDNKLHSKMLSSKKQKKEEEFIINEIFKNKIHINVYFFKKNIISYMPRRSSSCITFRRTEDLSDCDDTKLKFNEWINCHQETSKKIEKILFKLLIEIFNRRYKLYPNNMCPLSSFALKIKKEIEMFSEEFSELSIYILFLLRNKINDFLKYVDKEVNFKELTFEGYDKIKEIFYHIGQDIHKIFKSIFDDTENFKINSVLISLFEDYLNENNIVIKNKVRNVAIYNERLKFDNFLKVINNLSFNKNYDIFLDEKLFFDEDEDEKISTKININDDEKNNNTLNDDIKDNNEAEENNDKVENLNIEDLVNYINEPKKGKSKKKKKKKKKGNNVEKEEDKKKENSNENKNENNCNSSEDKFDIVFMNYKNSIEEYTRNILSSVKVRPKLSEAFLERLNIISQ